MARKPWETGLNTGSGDLLMSLDAQKSGLESPDAHPAEVENLLNPDSGATENLPGSTTNRLNRNTSDLGGYGSSFGGGMGSMYGGMGGMGSMYGMGGMGGMGMYGMGGMGMDPNSSFMQTMQFMQSLSFVVNSMCSVVGSIENNTNGLLFLYDCAKALVKRIVNWLSDSIGAIKSKFFALITKLMVMLRLIESGEVKVDKQIELDLTQEEIERLKEVKKKKRIYNFLMKVCGVLIIISCIYFYSIGKSFKVQFLKSRSASTDIGNAVEKSGADFDKMFKNAA